MTPALRALCGEDYEPRTRSTRWGLELSLWTGRCLAVQTCAADLDTATRNAAVILGRDDVVAILDAERTARVTAPTLPAPDDEERRTLPLYRVPPHPALVGIARRTKTTGTSAAIARDWLDAALADPQGRAVRIDLELTGEDEG